MTTALVDYLGLIMTPTANPAVGDLITRGASGGWTTTHVGSEGTFFQVVNGTPSWATLPASIVTDSSTTPVHINSTGIGSNQTLVYNSGTGTLIPGTPASVASWKGAYSSAITYALGEGVNASNGHNYISMVAGNINHDPTTDSGANWKDLLPPTAVFTSISSTPPGSGTNNEAFGALALSSNTTGSSGAAFGRGALTSNTTGLQNTAFGRQAATSVTTGSNVVAMGFQALQAEVSGVAGVIGTVAVGNQALSAQIGAQQNVAIGNGAGYNICQGLGNIGSRSTINAITFGSFNTIAGAASGPGTTTQLQGTSILGACSTVSGNYTLALGTNTQANYHGVVAIGTDSTGVGAARGIQDAIALGTALHMVEVRGCLTSALAGYERDSIVATGATTGTFTVSFIWGGNTYTTSAIAYNATAAAVQSALLAATRSGSVAFSTDTSADAIVCYGGNLPNTPVTVVFRHLAYGPVSGQAVNNSAMVGGNATFTSTVAGGSVTGNEATGFWALGSGNLTTGFNNTAGGFLALTNITSGGRNVGYGTKAGTLLTTGLDCTLMGANAGQNLVDGIQSTMIGARAGASFTTQAAAGDGQGGQHVTLVGAYAGTNLNGTHSTTGVGNEAFRSDVIGGQSTGVGNEAFWSQVGAVEGSYNTGVGNGVGYKTSDSIADRDLNGASPAWATVAGRGQTLMGYGASQGSANRSDAISAFGAFAHVDGYYGTALGYRTRALATGSVAVGTDSTGLGASTSTANDFVLGTTNHRVKVPGAFQPPQYSSAPTYAKGLVYFDTTLNKLRVGGATGWETITSV